MSENFPHFLTHTNFSLPPRILAILNAWVELRGNPQDHTQYPSMVVMPAIHISPKWTATIILFVLVNLSTESIFLSKNEILGLFGQDRYRPQQQPLNS